MRLSGKVAIVTGGARGIGKAYAETLSKEGAKVCIADVLDQEGKMVEKELRARGAEAFFAHTDITDEKNFQETAKKTVDTFGGVDVLVNNAALYGDMEQWDTLTGPLDYWKKLMDINVKGVLIGIRSVVPHMKAKGKGSIINQSSITAYFAGSAYGTSKLAVIGLTIGFANQLGPLNIRVNAIAPGLIFTEATQRLQSRRPSGQGLDRERVLNLQALKKAGEAEDLCGALVFLASEESNWMTGETMIVDGGWMRRV